VRRTPPGRRSKAWPSPEASTSSKFILSEISRGGGSPKD
jgi:hypothetical protein